MRLLPIGVIVILLAGVCLGPRAADLCRPAGTVDELPLFPSGKLLEAMPTGWRTTASDLAWLQAIQYYGKHHLEDRTYPMARHLFGVTTRLDPQFRNAYIFGGWVLGEEVGDMDAARALFDRGRRAIPNDWMLAFQRGFLESMRGDASRGALQMAHAAEMDGAPGYAARVAAFACTRAGRAELAIRLWEEIARDPDPAIRAVARERLRAIGTRVARGRDS